MFNKDYTLRRKFKMNLHCSNPIFYTSDLHFAHENLRVKYCDSRAKVFPTLEDMDRGLIENWNKTVPENGIVYFLGDFSLQRDVNKIKNVINQLNGTIYCIRGNHDQGLDAAYIAFPELQNKIPWIKDYFELTISDSTAPKGKQLIVLMHYAMRVWNKSHSFSWNLFGHSHNTLPDDPNALSYDVGVDSIAPYLASKENREIQSSDYRPISYNEVKELMSKKTYKPIDHHGAKVATN
jgi:calcineurin-like phosphoesterase family protein